MMALSWERARILSIINERGPMNISELAELAGLSKGTTIHRYVDELVERGLVEVYKEPKKRGKPTMVKITEKARPLAREVFHLSDKLKKVFD